MAMWCKILVLAMIVTVCCGWSTRFPNGRPGPYGRRTPLLPWTREGSFPPSSPPSGSRTVIVDGETLAQDGDVPQEVIDHLKSSGGKQVFIYANNSDTNIVTGGPDPAFRDEVRQMLTTIVNQRKEIWDALQDIQQQLDELTGVRGS